MSTFLSGLPPGFRFHPTDEELVAQYLRKRVYNKKMDYMVIRDHDLYKCEPWDLPNLSLISSSDNEWFFFSPRDRKYPNGSRTNRATEAGYWKATGRDRTVKSNNRPIGMKKTLVFYKGRAPHGERMDWLMHEYRLEGDKWETANNNNVEHGYVLCRVFKKLPFESQHQQQNEQPEEDDERRDDSPHEGSNSWSPEELDVKEDIPLIAMHPESAVDQKSTVSERYVSAPLSSVSAISESTVAAPFSSQGQVSESDVSGPFSSMYEGVKEENDTFFQGLDLWMQSMPAMPVTPATLAKIPEQVPERKDVETNFYNWDFGDPQTDLLGGYFDNPSALVGGNPSNWEIENYLQECPGLVDHPNELSPDVGSMVEETVCPAIQIRPRSTPMTPQVSWESYTDKYTANRRKLYQKDLRVQTSCVPPRSRELVPAAAALAEKVPTSDRSSVVDAPPSEDMNHPASELPSAAIAHLSDTPEESTSPRSESEDNPQSNSWAAAMITSPAADSSSTSPGPSADLDTESATARLAAEAGLEWEDETGKLPTDVDNDSKPTNVGGLLQLFVQPILAAAAAEHSSAALQQANFKASTELPAGIGSMRVNVVTITSTRDKVANQPQLQATIYNCFCNGNVPEGYNAEEKIANSAVPVGKEGAILVTATRGSSKKVFLYLFLLGVLSASFVFLVANRVSKFLGKDFQISN